MELPPQLPSQEQGQHYPQEDLPLEQERSPSDLPRHLVHLVPTYVL